MIDLRRLAWLWLLSVASCGLYGCPGGATDSPDCPDPRGTVPSAGTSTLVAGDADFCPGALAVLPTVNADETEQWKPDACELTQEGSGTDLEGDSYTFRNLCNVGPSGELDCELTLVWPAYGEVCVVRLSVP